MQRSDRTHGFTLVEVLVVVVVISVLAATVGISMTRVSLEQRTNATMQSLSEVRSSISLFRAGAVFEGVDPFPTLAELNSGSLLPSGQLPVNPFTGYSVVAESSDLASASARSVVMQPAGWVYFASTGSNPVALFYANADVLTEQSDPDTGAVLTANAL